MDLASGYSDSTNYGNGYTPLANNAINNNNFNYLSNQAAAQQAGMYNPFAQSGGFGAQTSYYSGLGADYGRAVGGGGNIYASPGGGGSNPYSYDDSAGLNQSTAPQWDPSSGWNQDAWRELFPPANPSSQRLLGYDPNNPFVGMSGTGGGIGSDAARSPAQYQNPAVDWSKYFAGATSNVPQGPQTYPMSPGGGLQTQSGWSQTPGGNPDMQRLLGYTPQQIYSGGGIGSDAVRDPYQDWLQNSAASQGYKTYGGGGIGSDTMRDQFAWQLAQSSPWATPGAPANGPYPNMGYNPGMANSFANPTMQQYDWTKNNATLQQQMQDALKTIDGATGNQPAQPYGGALPPFWQGIRDATGMGAPQPTPPQDTWTNRS